MASPVAKILTGFAVVAGVVLVGVIWLVSSQSGPAPPPMPNPNGYDGLVKAARMLKGDTDYSTANGEALRRFRRNHDSYASRKPNPPPDPIHDRSKSSEIR